MAVRSWQADASPLVLGIDGLPFSGKSFLAGHLQSALQGGVVGLDAFLVRNQGSFVESVRFPDLKRAIESQLACERLLVVEGVCLLAVAEILALRIDRLVVVKVTNERRKWMEQEGIEEPVDLVGLNPLDREVHEYALKHEPEKKADLVFERHES